MAFLRRTELDIQRVISGADMPGRAGTASSVYGGCAKPVPEPPEPGTVRCARPLPPARVAAAGLAGAGGLRQGDGPAGVDHLVEGDRRLVLHALAARLRADA